MLENAKAIILLSHCAEALELLRCHVIEIKLVEILKRVQVENWSLLDFNISLHLMRIGHLSECRLGSVGRLLDLGCLGRVLYRCLGNFFLSLGGRSLFRNFLSRLC